MIKKLIILTILSIASVRVFAQKIDKSDRLPAYTSFYNINKIVLEVYKIDSVVINNIDQTKRYRNASAAIIYYTQSNYTIH